MCNTWFKKNDIYKQTWQHPKSKWWYCINYAIMRKTQCWICMDVVVKRGAACNTDHSLLWMKMRIGKKFSIKHGSKERLVKRFDVAKLQGACEDSQGRELLKVMFVSAVSDTMEQNWDQASTAQEKWKVLRCHVQCC